MFKFYFDTEFSETSGTFEQVVYADSEQEAWKKLAERNLMFRDYGYPVKVTYRAKGRA